MGLLVLLKRNHKVRFRRILYRVSHSLPNPAFFNNSNTNEDIATKFEQEYVRCVRNEKECVCSVCL